MLRPLSAVLCALALTLAACGGDDDSSGDSSTTAKTTTAAQTKRTQGTCRDVEQPAPRDGGSQKKPKKLLSRSKQYDVTLSTTCGSFTIRLDQKTSPNAAASFAALARAGFFDDTIFHRIVPGFVIQGGDPTVTGSGGPGYSTRDKVPANAQYGPGVVAMAKAGNEPPGTAGSQFFVATGPGLTPDYAIVGEVTDGLDVVKRIGRFGDPSDPAGAPTQIVTIEKSRVSGG